MLMQGKEDRGEGGGASFWMSNVNPSALHKDTTGKVFAQRLLLQQGREVFERFFWQGYLHEVYTRGFFPPLSPPPFLLWFLTSLNQSDRLTNGDRAIRLNLRSRSTNARATSRISGNSKGRKERITQGFQEVGNWNPRERDHVSVPRARDKTVQRLF